MSHAQRLPRRKKPSDARGVAFDTLELMETDEAFLQFALDRIAREARRTGEARPEAPHLSFRLVFIAREGDALERHVLYMSEAVPIDEL